jgi:hypothetical protein
MVCLLVPFILAAASLATSPQDLQVSSPADVIKMFLVGHVIYVMPLLVDVMNDLEAKTGVTRNQWVPPPHIGNI